MIFRRCKKEDLPVIRDVLADSFANYFFPVNPSLSELDEKLESLSVDYGNSLLMYVDEVPVGIAICGVRDKTTHLGPMGISLKHQGQGYGKELLQALIRLHKEIGFKNILLEVICENKRAYELYKNTGFKIIRKLRGFKAMARPLSFDPSITVIQKNPEELLKTFNDFHEDENPSWQLDYECIAKSKINIGFAAYKNDTLAGYALVKDARIAGLGIKKRDDSFDIFKALASKMFTSSSFLFIFDLPEENICVKHFENAGFEKFFDQYEMTLDLQN